MDQIEPWEKKGLPFIQVEFWTERYCITGKVYMPVGAGRTWRLSDIMNRTDRSFIPVTDTTIVTLDTKETVWQGAFLALHKVFIVMATSSQD